VYTTLIVEDSPVESAIISECLQRSGFAVLKAKSAEEALDLLRQRQQQLPDVVVIDIVLPGLSGFDLCREMRANQSTQHIPIAICSTKSSETDKFWGRSQGANAYLTKPVNQEELVKTIQSLVSK